MIKAAVLLAFLVGPLAMAQDKFDEAIAPTVQATLSKFPKMKPEEIAISAIDLSRTNGWSKTSYRSDVPIYPASVVKLFYLEAAHRWMDTGKLQDSPELRRAMKDMIVLSYNEATHYVLDVLTETTSGPELPAAEMETWSHKRNAVNRYFASRGFEKINANQKPWCEGPYGRDRIFVGQTYTNRNMLTTEATARLLQEIATGKAVSPERDKEMMELLARDPSPGKRNSESQVTGFIGDGVPEGTKLWSKAGWTSSTRHDAAYLELPNGKKLVLVIFTVNHAGDATIIPFVAKTFIAALD